MKHKIYHLLVLTLFFSSSCADERNEDLSIPETESSEKIWLDSSAAKNSFSEDALYLTTIWSKRDKAPLLFSGANLPVDNPYQKSYSFKIQGDYLYALGSVKAKIAKEDEVLLISYPSQSSVCDIETVELNNKKWIVFKQDQTICELSNDNQFIYFGGDKLRFSKLRMPNKIQIQFPAGSSRWTVKKLTDRIEFTGSNSSSSYSLKG